MSKRPSAHVPRRLRLDFFIAVNTGTSRLPKYHTRLEAQYHFLRTTLCIHCLQKYTLR